MSEVIYTQKKCRNCHKFIIYGSSFRRYYCSEKCYLESHPMMRCPICGKEYIKSIRRSLFCKECLIRMNVSQRHRHPLFKTYNSMLQRCYNPNRINYQHYGAKGIRVCDRWLVFDNFLDDMGYRPGGMTLDRIDSMKDYSPDNCRWASINEQRINRGRFKNTTRKYKGVSLHGEKFVSSIRHNGISIYLGSFDTEIEAALAYNDKVKEFYPKTWKSYINEVDV